MKELKVGTVEFFVGKVRHRFKVINDMPETHGLSHNDAVTNWVHRTDNYSAQSFCDYVESKGTGNVCCIASNKNIKKYLQHSKQ